MGRANYSPSNFLKLCAAWGAMLLFAPVAFAGDNEQVIPTGRAAIAKQQESLQMIVSTSQYLTFPQAIATATINNPTVLSVQATQKNEILVSALATGVTQIDAKGVDDTVYNIQVIVMGDARELQSILNQHFPTATLKVQPIRESVIISGQVTADEQVEQVITIAEEFYPRVINRIEVLGVHTIMLHTQVMEVSRTKLRQLGIDWSAGFGNDFVTTSASGLIAPGGDASTVLNAGNETFKLGVINNNNDFFGLVRALRQNNMAKVLADPTVVAIDGRPASFNSGGEFPIIVPAGLGQVGIEFREYGTRLEFVAKVKGDGRIWLDVRPTISEIDPGRSVTIQGTSVPGIRSRFVDTAVELRAGQTLALAGLLQMRTESESIGILGLADIPYLGALFRSNREVQNEIELLILVTPNFAAPMDAHEVPIGGPGFNSTSPLDKELYMKGYIEVPNTCGPEGCPPNNFGATDCPPGTPMGAPAPIASPYQSANAKPTNSSLNGTTAQSPTNATLYNQAYSPAGAPATHREAVKIPAQNASYARPYPATSR